MKTITLIIFLFTWNHLAFTQSVHTISGFSNQYFGRVQISDTSQAYSKGWIAIYDKKSNKQIIQVISDELTLSLHDNKTFANLKSLAYSEQSLIMYDDFNFDNKKDFAICDGQNSCYHGPSFKIYLATDKGFSFNEEFTRLAQEYCGMFQVDYNTKTVSTMTKSGCCLHEYSEFVVENNKPKNIKIITEEQDFPYNTYSEQIWNGKTMEKKIIKTIDTEQDGIQVILSFEVPENGKKIILFNINDRTLNYAVVRRDSTVEFNYPIETISQYSNFQFDSSESNKSVTFSDGNATYKIYDLLNQLGVEITVDGKTYSLVADIKTRKGGLENLVKIQLENVIVH